ncbi:MAG: hypothetical protein SGBAC_000756 [Bacillariaceae sp.]
MDIPNEKKQVDLASAYYTKGRKLWSKGDRDNALDLFRKALSIQESILGIYNKQTARTYYWVGYALNHRKEYSKALVAYRRTLRIRLFLLGEDDASTEDVKRASRDVLKEQGLDDVRIKAYLETVAAAVAHEKQAIIHEEMKEYAEAVEEYEKYLAIEEASVGNFPLDIARIHSKIADIHKLNKKETMALSCYRRALSIFISKLGRKHSDSQHCISGIEICASIRGLKAAESEEYMELVLESISLIRQGDELKNRGYLDEAIIKYEEALKIESMTIGIYQLTAAQLHLDIAYCYCHEKEFDRAIVMLRTALSIFIFEHGEDHPTVRSCLRDLASTLQEKGCSSADMKKYLNTVSSSVKYERRGESMRKEGDFAGAITELQRSLELEVAVLGKYHLAQVALYKGIARAYDARGEYSFALSSYRTAILTCMTTLGLRHPTTQALFIETFATAKREGCDCTTIEAYENLVSTSIELQMSGNDQLEKGQYVRAFATFQKAIVDQEEASVQYHICTSDLYANAAKSLLCSGQDDRALKKYRELLAVHQFAFGPNHPSSQGALQGIGEALSAKRVKIELANDYSEKVVKSIGHELTGDNEIKQGLYHQAILSYEQALKIERDLLGEFYLTTAGLFEKLASAYRLQGEHHRAILIYRKSIQIYQFYNEPEDGDTQRTLKHLSLSIRSLGFNVSAAERYQDAIQSSIAYETQGDAALLAGNSAKAVSKYQLAIETEEEVLGKLYPTTSSFYKKIAHTSRDKEDFESAVLFYSKALAIEESYLGKDDEDTVTTYNQLMNAAQKHGSKSGVSLDGWNMLKYVLMALIGLLVLIISVVKSMSTRQRTIKKLKIAAYNKVDDSKDEDADDKDSDNAQRPLEPPEERFISQGGWSANSSSYETMSGHFSRDTSSPSVSRRLTGKSVILKPMLSKTPSALSVKDAILAHDKMITSKGSSQKEGDRVAKKGNDRVGTATPKVSLSNYGDAASRTETESVPVSGKADEQVSPLGTKGEVGMSTVIEAKIDAEKESEAKSPMPTNDGIGRTAVDESKDTKGAADIVSTMKTLPRDTNDAGDGVSKIKSSPNDTKDAGDRVSKTKMTPKDTKDVDDGVPKTKTPPKGGVLSGSSGEKGQSSSDKKTKPETTDKEASSHSPKEERSPPKDEVDRSEKSLLDKQDGKLAELTKTKAASWDAVLKEPKKSDKVETPTIDDKIKSRKTAKKKGDEGNKGGLSQMLNKWRKKADNEPDDSEEATSGLDNRIKKWKQAADRASVRHLGA